MHNSCGSYQFAGATSRYPAIACAAAWMTACKVRIPSTRTRSLRSRNCAPSWTPALRKSHSWFLLFVRFAINKSSVVTSAGHPTIDCGRINQELRNVIEWRYCLVNGIRYDPEYNNFNSSQWRYYIVGFHLLSNSR